MVNQQNAYWFSVVEIKIVKHLDVTVISTIKKTEEEINNGVFQARISVRQSMDYTLHSVKENTVLSSCLLSEC